MKSSEVKLNQMKSIEIKCNQIKTTTTVHPIQLTMELRHHQDAMACLVLAIVLGQIALNLPACDSLSLEIVMHTSVLTSERIERVPYAPLCLRGLSWLHDTQSCRRSFDPALMKGCTLQEQSEFLVAMERGLPILVALTLHLFSCSACHASSWQVLPRFAAVLFAALPEGRR